MTTTIELIGGCLGSERMLLSCDLVQAASTIWACYNPDSEPDVWSPTPYQCADVRHRVERLAELGQELANRACETYPDLGEYEPCLWGEVVEGERPEHLRPCV